MLPRSTLTGALAGRALRRYALFGGIVVVLTLILDWFEPLLGLALLAPYLVLVVAAARWGGLGVAIFTCLLAVPIADYLLFEPSGTFNLSSRQMLQFSLVLVAGLWLGWLMDGLRLARTRAESAVEAERAAQQERDALLSVIAHDLRNPLASVRARIQLAELVLRRESADLGQALKSLSLAVPQVDRVNRLLDDLVSAGQSNGKLAVAPSDLDLSLLVERVAERWQGEASSHLFEIQVSGPLPVRADPGRLEQVLDNLFGNAVKYSPPGSTIQVNAAPHASEARVSVADQGSGIAAADCSRVFERFYRQQHHRETDQPGLGLGLYITQRLVSAHGGRIWVESPAAGGARFTVALPLREGQEIAQSA